MTAKYRNLVVICQTLTRVYSSSVHAVRRLVNILINQHAFMFTKYWGYKQLRPPTSLFGEASPHAP